MKISDHFKKILIGKDSFTDILAQDKIKQQLNSALISGRNVIIVGPPGIGKTTLAKNVSKLLPEMEVNDCGYNCDPKNPICPKCLSGEKVNTKKISGNDRFVRVQGSPDLTAEDLLGDIDPVMALKYGPLSEKAFSPGKIFKANNGVLFFDELNRSPEKLQNAMLQVLEEKTVTIGSYVMDFNVNFIFIGTMNPTDRTTEELSDVFVDRFDFIYMEYPKELETEIDIVKANGKKIVNFDETLLERTIKFVRVIRESPKLEKKPSVRASLGLYERAQANAYLRGKKEVEFKDVMNAVKSVLVHRIRLKASVKYMMDANTFISEQFAQFCENEHIEGKQSDLG
jgi:magnesium chelatase subunit I